VKACGKCFVEKPLSDFRWRFDRKKYSGVCFQCTQRRHAAAHVKRRSRRLVDPSGNPWPLAPEIKALNNAFGLWHGPVNRAPLKWAA
jgi:hypothetical protein